MIPKIRLVNQIDYTTCTQACLAMITGLEIEHVLEKLPQKPQGTHDEEAVAFLSLHNIGTIEDAQFFANSLYLVSVPSLHYPNRFHHIVVDMRGWDETRRYAPVYDPQEGREGKELWKFGDIWSDRCVTRLRIVYAENFIPAQQDNSPEGQLTELRQHTVRTELERRAYEMAGKELLRLLTDAVESTYLREILADEVRSSIALYNKRIEEARKQFIY
jgi:hypothetical protein